MPKSPQSPWLALSEGWKDFVGVPASLPDPASRQGQLNDDNPDDLPHVLRSATATRPFIPSRERDGSGAVARQVNLADRFLRLARVPWSCRTILFSIHARTSGPLAARAKLPAMYHIREFVEAGGLMSYGANLADAYRKAGGYVGKVLLGAKVRDLPIARSTRLEMVLGGGLCVALPDELVAGGA